jgi:hypothetical protein
MHASAVDSFEAAFQAHQQFATNITTENLIERNKFLRAVPSF